MPSAGALSSILYGVTVIPGLSLTGGVRTPPSRLIPNPVDGDPAAHSHCNNCPYLIRLIEGVHSIMFARSANSFTCVKLDNAAR